MYEINVVGNYLFDEIFFKFWLDVDFVCLEGIINLFFFFNSFFEEGGGFVVIVGVIRCGLFLFSDILCVIRLLLFILVCNIFVMSNGM